MEKQITDVQPDDISNVIDFLAESHVVLFLTGEEQLADVVVTALASGDPEAQRAAYLKVRVWELRR